MLDRFAFIKICWSSWYIFKYFLPAVFNIFYLRASNFAWSVCQLPNIFDLQGLQYFLQASKYAGCHFIPKILNLQSSIFFAGIKICLSCVSNSKYLWSVGSSIFLQASKYVGCQFIPKYFGSAIFNTFCRHQNTPAVSLFPKFWTWGLKYFLQASKYAACQFIPKYFGPAVFNIDSGQQGLRQVNKWLRCLDSGGRAHKECDSNNQQSPFQESSI